MFDMKHIYIVLHIVHIFPLKYYVSTHISKLCFPHQPNHTISHNKVNFSSANIIHI